MGVCIDAYNEARKILKEYHSDRSMVLHKLEELWLGFNDCITMTNEDRLICLYMDSFEADAIHEKLDDIYDL